MEGAILAARQIVQARPESRLWTSRQLTHKLSASTIKAEVLDMIKIVVSTVFFIILTGCANRQPTPNYVKLLESHTNTQKIYDGLVELLEYNSTFLSRDLALAQVTENSQIYQYSESQFNNETATVQANLAKQTEFFLSLFVTETKYDDLAKKSTKWKVFLDVAGKRYEPKITRIKSQLLDIQTLYPFQNRFTTAYKLIFPVPTGTVESNTAKLTLTGPMTSVAINYDHGLKTLK